MRFTKEEKFDYTAPYRQSDSVIRAQQAVQAQQNLKPDQYQSRWQDQLDAMMGQIQDRPAFQYDVNADALWNQYKDQYLTQGRQAMMDTMGQAAAMTGGYGNSYAQTVGQQAYQGYLQGLNAKIPELYQLALGKYQMEGDNLLNQYGMMADVEGQEYGRYMDALNQYYAELDRLQGIYDSERNYDYGMWADNRDFSYAQYRDQIADQQWQAQWDENIRRYNFENGLGEYASSGGGDDDDENTGSSSRSPAVPPSYTLDDDITFRDVGLTAEKISAAGGDAGAYITAARQAGVISRNDEKSLKYTFGY
jgi:hypothetical protein